MSNRNVQAWLEQVQAAQNISETTLATAAIEFKISSFAAEEQSAAKKVRHSCCSRDVIPASLIARFCRKRKSPSRWAQRVSTS